MVNKCALDYCRTGRSESTVKKSTFHFPLQDAEICEKWEQFVSRKGWKATAYSVICEDHFDPRYIKVGEKRNKLIESLRPVPTIHTAGDEIPKSTLHVPSLPRPPPTNRSIQPDQKLAYEDLDKIKSFQCLSGKSCPPGFSFKQHKDKVVFFNLHFDYVTSVPMIFESIVVDQNMHVTLSYKGNHVPLPEWFRGNRFKLDRFSVLTNFPSYIRAKANEVDSVLEEINEIKHFRPQGRPPYSASTIRWALLLRHTSPQAYRMLLEKLPVPSFSLLKKIQRGGLDAVKAIQRLLQQQSISKDCVLLVDEMYLRKISQYFSGNQIGENEEGVLYKGLVSFMIVGLSKSIPYVVKSSPEVTITGEWLWIQLDECIQTLAKAGFNIRAVIADDHTTNVSAYAKLHQKYDGDGQTYIFHSAYGGSMKTYLFFDIVHLIKNVRNNLLSKKKFVFPKFSFELFEDKIEVDAGFVDWSLLHKVHEKDSHLQANLRKAPEITSQVLHPGNKKQNVKLALSIFAETTSAGIKSYFPHRETAAHFLNLFHKLFVIFNSKQQYNNRERLGHAAVSGDNKPAFFRAVADWIEEWSECPNFTLTPQTSAALVTTLRSSASLIEDLLAEGFKYVLTARLQSDPIELHFSKYRQMSGGSFLVSLCDVQNSERILAIDKLLKEGINFWEEDLRPDNTAAQCEAMNMVNKEVEKVSTEILESQLTDDSTVTNSIEALFIPVNEKRSRRRYR